MSGYEKGLSREHTRQAGLESTANQKKPIQHHGPHIHGKLTRDSHLGALTIYTLPAEAIHRGLHHTDG